MKTKHKQNFLAAALIGAAVFSAIVPAHAQDKKPNILILWGDDVGQFNVSAYNMGMMGLPDAEH